MGCYLNMPTIPHQTTNEDHASKLAVSLGYDGNLSDHKKLLSFLKRQPTILLIGGCRNCQKDLQQVTSSERINTN